MAKPPTWNGETETLQLLLEAWRSSCWTVTENGTEYLDSAPRLLDEKEKGAMRLRLAADGLRNAHTREVETIYRRSRGAKGYF